MYRVAVSCRGVGRLISLQTDSLGAAAHHACRTYARILAGDLAAIEPSTVAVLAGREELLRIVVAG